jgi:hypothetical protein
MKKYFSILAAFLVIIASLAASVLLTGCTKLNPSHEGFAIYLTKDDVSPFKMPALNRIKIADTPLVALNDIVTYDSLTCELTIADSAATRISNLTVPTSGLSFVVCVNRQPVYWGVIWPEYSSAIPPASCVLVSYPLSHTVNVGDAQTIELSPNIIALSYYGTDDPRNNPAIIASLQQAGKLNHEGFAIYLPEGVTSPTNMPALDAVRIPAQPLISLTDIFSYNSTTWELTLTTAAINRLIALQVPVYGKPFVVCVDRNPVYAGAFWSPVSSVSFNGITIAQPLNDQTDTVTIQLGYPAQSLFTGADPRNNAAIIDSFQQTGKLTFVQDNMLPHSLDGYEIYSWQQDNQWNYTLITGTDREKTTQEIVTANNTVTADGWVNIHVVGLDALKAVLARVSHSDFISWVSGRPADSAQFGVTFAVPPADIVTAIKTYADRYGLNLIVFSPGS